MTKASNPDDTAAATDVAVIGFGKDDKGRAHASLFTAIEAELAIKAAGLLGMRVLSVTTDEHRAAASPICHWPTPTASAGSP